MDSYTWTRRKRKAIAPNSHSCNEPENLRTQPDPDSLHVAYMKITVNYKANTRYF